MPALPNTVASPSNLNALSGSAAELYVSQVVDTGAALASASVTVQNASQVSANATSITLSAAPSSTIPADVYIKVGNTGTYIKTTAACSTTTLQVEAVPAIITANTSLVYEPFVKVPYQTEVPSFRPAVTTTDIVTNQGVVSVPTALENQEFEFATLGALTDPAIYSLNKAYVNRINNTNGANNRVYVVQYLSLIHI